VSRGVRAEETKRDISRGCGGQAEGVGRAGTLDPGGCGYRMDTEFGYHRAAIATTDFGFDGSGLPPAARRLFRYGIAGELFVLETVDGSISSLLGRRL
jgi:hypothetical protein